MVKSIVKSHNMALVFAVFRPFSFKIDILKYLGTEDFIQTSKNDTGYLVQ